MAGIDDLVCVADPDSRELLFVNSALRDYAGDVVGKKCYAALRGRTRPCPFCANQEIFGPQRGQTLAWERFDETLGRWYRCADKAIRWTDGRWVRLQMVTDITEARRTAEPALTDEARWRALFETSSMALWEEDYSAVKRLLDRWREEAKGDLVTLLRRRPDKLLDAIRAVRVLNANSAASALHTAKVAADPLQIFASSLIPGSLRVYIKQLVALASGQRVFHAQARHRKIDGTSVNMLLTVHLPAESSNWERVVVGLADMGPAQSGDTTTIEREAELVASHQRIEHVKRDLQVLREASARLRFDAAPQVAQA